MEWRTARVKEARAQGMKWLQVARSDDDLDIWLVEGWKERQKPNPPPQFQPIASDQT